MSIDSDFAVRSDDDDISYVIYPTAITCKWGSYGLNASSTIDNVISALCYSQIDPDFELKFGYLVAEDLGIPEKTPYMPIDFGYAWSQLSASMRGCMLRLRLTEMTVEPVKSQSVLRFRELKL